MQFRRGNRSHLRRRVCRLPRRRLPGGRCACAEWPEAFSLSLSYVVRAHAQDSKRVLTNKAAAAAAEVLSSAPSSSSSSSSAAVDRTSCGGCQCAHNFDRNLYGLFEGKELLARSMHAAAAAAACLRLPANRRCIIMSDSFARSFARSSARSRNNETVQTNQRANEQAAISPLLHCGARTGGRQTARRTGAPRG